MNKFARATIKLKIKSEKLNYYTYIYVCVINALLIKYNIVVFNSEVLTYVKFKTLIGENSQALLFITFL